MTNVDLSIETPDTHIENQSNDHVYFTMLPNMIWLIELSSFDILLYAYLKKVAGAEGTCWMSTRSLAKATGMSVGQVADSRQVLYDKGLITCEKRKQRTNEWATWHVRIVDIWARNLELCKNAEPPSRFARKRSLREHKETVHTMNTSAENCSQNDHKEEPVSKKNHKERERAAFSPQPAGPPPDAPTAQAQALAAQANGAVAPYVEAFLRGYGLVAADVPKAEMAKVQAACLAFMAIESKPTAEQLERCTAWKLAVFTQKANWPGSPSMAVDWITKDYANWRRLKEPTPESVAQQSSRPPRPTARPGRAVPAPQPRHAPGAKLEDVYDVPAGWPGRRQAP
jgi:hypothetical protein